MTRLGHPLQVLSCGAMPMTPKRCANTSVQSMRYMFPAQSKCRLCSTCQKAVGQELEAAAGVQRTLQRCPGIGGRNCRSCRHQAFLCCCQRLLRVCSCFCTCSRITGAQSGHRFCQQCITAAWLRGAVIPIILRRSRSSQRVQVHARYKQAAQAAQQGAQGLGMARRSAVGC